MGLIVDGVIALFIALVAFIAYKRGLTKSIFGILSFAISLILAVVLYAPVSNFIVNNTQVDERMNAAIVNLLENKTQDKGKDESKFDVLPDAVQKYVDQELQQTKSSAIVSSAGYVTQLGVKIIAMLAVFVLSKLILVLVKQITNLVVKLPIIKQADHLGGLIFGLIKGLLIVYALLAMISFVGPAYTPKLVENIVSSSLGKALYNNNLILNFIIK